MSKAVNMNDNTATNVTAASTGYIPPSIAKVEAKYDALNQLISQLAQKISGVSSNIEGEFLAAYRVHMLEIQNELKDLRQKVQNAEEDLKKDESVAKLEVEVTWFNDEGTRLKTHASNMKRDMVHMQTRIKALKEQKLFLSEQLKSIMKRTRIYETEIQLFGGTSVSNNNASQTMKNSHSQLQGISQVEETINRSNSLKPIRKKKNLFKKSQSTPVLSPSPWDTKVNASVPKEREPATLNEIEQLLEQSLKYTWSTITERKLKTAVWLGIGKGNADKPVDLNRIKPSGISGLGTDYFSEIDRLSAVVNFVAHPKVFEKVVLALNSYID